MEIRIPLRLPRAVVGHLRRAQKQAKLIRDGLAQLEDMLRWALEDEERDEKAERRRK